MLHKHHALRRACAVNFHYMVSHRGRDYRRYVAGSGGVGGILECVGKAAGNDIAHVAAVAHHCAVDGVFARHGLEVGAGEDRVAHGVEELALVGMSVGGCVGHHDVAHVDLGAHAGVLGVYDGVFHLLHSEIGGGKVTAVAVELALEGLALVYAGFLGRCYLLLVGDKHLQVLVDCLRS